MNMRNVCVVTPLRSPQLSLRNAKRPSGFTSQFFYLSEATSASYGASLHFHFRCVEQAWRSPHRAGPACGEHDHSAEGFTDFS